MKNCIRTGNDYYSWRRRSIKFGVTEPIPYSDSNNQGLIISTFQTHILQEIIRIYFDKRLIKMGSYPAEFRFGFNKKD